MILFRPAIEEDVIHVAANLREADRRELATTGGDVAKAFCHSTECFAVFSTAKVNPVGLVGVVPDDADPDRGIVWFVATDQLRGSQISLLRESRRWLDYLSRHYANGLYNYADSRNDAHIRWCQLTGFTFGGTVDIHGVPFVHITRYHGAPHLV